MGYIAMARETFPRPTSRYAMLSNFSSGIDRGDAKLLDGDGIPVLEGTLTGLAAFRHLFAYRDARARPPVGGGSPVTDEVRARWIERLSSGEPFDELEGLALLADYGVPVVESVRRRDARGRDRGRRTRSGSRSRVKTAAPGVQHKSDVGGCGSGVDDSPSLEDAYGDLERRLGPQVTVAPMAPAGIEIALGIVRDPQFGPLVLVGAGGVLVEVLKDRRARAASAGRGSSTVDGRPPEGPSAPRWGSRRSPRRTSMRLARAVVAFSWLAHDLGDHLEALDVNPVICGPEGCVAVDALVALRTTPA